MPEETKCPKCGAEVIAVVGNVTRFACLSHFVGPEYRPSDNCIILTLRAALSKAKKWMGHNYFCVKRKKAAFDAGDHVECDKCSCGLVDFLAELSTLTRAENGDL